MTDQVEMWPKTELDEATAILQHLIEEKNKADKAVRSAEDKLEEAEARVEQQREVVAYLQSKMPPAEPVMEGEEVEAEDAEVEPEPDEPAELPAEDETRGDGVVCVLWPDGHELVRTGVGSRTLYRELVADFISDGRDVPSENWDHYQILGPEGEVRNPSAAITEDDYGLDFQLQYVGER